MKNVYLSLLLTLSCTIINAQGIKLDWVGSVGGSSGEITYAITLDADRYVYVTGSFQDTADFDPSVTFYNLTSNGFADVFILKLDSSGMFLWAKSVGGTSSESGQSIITDVSGNVYVTGYYYSNTIDFDPGVDTFNLSSNGNSDMFVLKLDANGNFIWAKSIGGTSVDQAMSLTTDGFQNVYVSGAYRGTTDFDPGVDTFNLTSNGFSDVFILKLDSAGDFIWAKSLGGESGQSVTVDASGNVYTTGYFSGTDDFDPNGTSFYLTAFGSLDAYIVKLNVNGDFVWAKSMGGASVDEGLCITTDAQENVYSTGYYVDSADFDPSANNFMLESNGGYDVFIQKLDSNGNFIWAKTIGGTSSDYCYSIIANEYVYITGLFRDTADFDPSSASYELTSNGSADVFFAKFDTGGNFLWAKSIGGALFDKGRSISADSSGIVYATGEYNGTVDFNPGANTFNLTSTGGPDIFIERLIPCIPSIGTDIITACDSITWIDGNSYISDNNSAKYLLTNLTGCDSLVTLELTIINSGMSTDFQTACFAYEWIDSITYISSNSTATFNFIGGASNGCDSIVTLNLTINNVNVGVTISDSSITANATGANYQWLDCSTGYTVIVGATTQSFIPITTGEYAVEVTENGCTDTSACSSIIVSIEVSTQFSRLSIFPNPSTGNIRIELGDLKDIAIEIFNITGQLIYSEENINVTTYQLTLDEAPGIYIVQISIQGTKQQYKLVKM